MENVYTYIIYIYIYIKILLSYIRLSLSLYICIYVYIYINIRDIYINIYIYINIGDIYIYIYIHIYIYIMYIRKIKITYVYHDVQEGVSINTPQYTSSSFLLQKCNLMCLECFSKLKACYVSVAASGVSFYTSKLIFGSKEVWRAPGRPK